MCMRIITMWRSSPLRRSIHTSFRVLKKLKGKSTAEQRWTLRQLRDPYVKASHVQNYRCRSAFKLLEIDDKFRLLQPGLTVVDCGAAPGAWSQVAVQRVNSTGAARNPPSVMEAMRRLTYRDEMFSCILDPELPRGTVVGIDLLNVPPLEGAHFLSSHDVTDPATHGKLLQLLPSGQAHVILSDMAPNASGLREMDHERLVTMCLSLVDLAERVLLPGGSLLCKYWDGILARKLQERLLSVFVSVRTLKPNASRKESAERYFLARMHRKPVK